MLISFALFALLCLHFADSPLPMAQCQVQSSASASAAAVLLAPMRLVSCAAHEDATKARRRRKRSCAQEGLACKFMSVRWLWRMCD